MTSDVCFVCFNFKGEKRARRPKASEGMSVCSRYNEQEVRTGTNSFLWIIQ